MIACFSVSVNRSVRSVERGTEEEAFREEVVLRIFAHMFSIMLASQSPDTRGEREEIQGEREGEEEERDVEDDIPSLPLAVALEEEANEAGEV
mmetsp:Transcript_14931/g.15037  ORF Transcript_14931/g.15037 Transcript_14931/m.15037 type:complete len:93 (+) Transcript_14931:788-1066(+)